MGLGKDAVGTVNGGLAGTSETELGVDTLNAVRRVDILDQGDLPAGGTALAGGDCRGSKEILPDLDRVNKIGN